MTSAAVLAQAEGAGLRLQLDNGHVRVRGNGDPPADLLAALHARRDDVAYLLALRSALYAASHQPNPDDATARRAALQWRADPHMPPVGARKGWCCATCHPSNGLTPRDFEQVGT